MVGTVVVTWAAVSSHSDSPRNSAPASVAAPAPSQDCFITGTGEKLCGTDAVSYCGIHMPDYISGVYNGAPYQQAISSMDACLDTGYHATESDKEQAWVAFNDGPLSGVSDPLPAPSRACQHDANSCEHPPVF